MLARQLLRTGGVIVGGQALIAVIGVVALRLYTGLLSTSIFGESNLILGAMGLGLQLFVAGFTAVQLRYYSEAELAGRATQFTQETMKWSMRAVSILIVAGLIALSWRAGHARTSYPWDVAISGTAWLVVMTVRSVLMTRVQAERRQAAYVGFQVLEALLLVSTTTVALGMAPAVKSYLGGQALAIAVLICVIGLLDRRPRSVIGKGSNGDSKFLSKAWSYGLPFTPLSVFGWLANQGDRYTLALLLGAGATGRYVATFSIASRGMMFSNTALCDLFRPLLFDAENRRDARQARRLFAAWVTSSIILSILGMATLYIAGGLIVTLLLPPAYREGAVSVMLWVALGYAINGVTQVLENRMLSLGLSARLLGPMLFGAAANVAFSFLLIPSHGIAGAAQATCASFLAQSAVTAVFLFHANRRVASRRSAEVPIGLA